MYLKIENTIVRKNIELCKIILHRVAEYYKAEESEKTSRYFKAFVHKLHGEIRFSDLNTDSLQSQEWTPISFRFSLPNTPGESFSIDISSANDFFFSWNGLDPNALNILRQTLKTIRLISKFLPRLQSLSAALREFSITNLDTFLDNLSSKDLIHEAWHSLQRIECEELLRHEKPGVFLFRKDEFATYLEELLCLEHQESIHCITLSYVTPLHHIADLTLVKRTHGWIIFEDPRLEGTIYPSAHSLLETLRGVLQSPLLHNSS